MKGLQLDRKTYQVCAVFAGVSFGAVAVVVGGIFAGLDTYATIQTDWSVRVALARIGDIAIGAAHLPRTDAFEGAG